MGQKISIVKQVETIRDFLKEFFEETNITYQYKLDMSIHDSMNNVYALQNILDTQNKFLIENYENCFNDYVDFQSNLFILFFIFFVVFVLILAVGFWLQFAIYLQNLTWKTKNMLSVIPLNVITANEDLRKAFRPKGAVYQIS